MVGFDGLATVEPFDEDLEGEAHPGADAWRAALRGCDGVLIVTPEYNASIPGQLKNAVDWASRSEEPPRSELRRNALFGRPVAVASASTSQFGGVWAADELRKSLKAAGARVVEGPVVALGGAATGFDEDGQLASRELRTRLPALVAAVAEHVQRLRDAGVTTST